MSLLENRPQCDQVFAETWSMISVGMVRGLTVTIDDICGP